MIEFDEIRAESERANGLDKSHWVLVPIGRTFFSAPIRIWPARAGWLAGWLASWRQTGGREKKVNLGPGAPKLIDPLRTGWSLA